MTAINDQGQRVYYNCVVKHGRLRWVVLAGSGQVLRGRDGQKLKSRTFAQEHTCAAYLERNGYKTIG